MQLIKSKKGVVDQLAGIAIALVTVAITLVVAFLIFSKIRSNTEVAADPNATSAINLVTTATGQIPSWLSIVVIVAIGGLLIGMVAYFRGK